MPNTCLNNNHVPGQFYVPTTSGFWNMPLLTLLKCALVGKGLFWHWIKKNSRYDIFLENVVPKQSFFFVASDVIPILYNKPCTCTGD